MKISAKHYAQALIGSLWGKSEDEAKAAVDGFVRVLDEDGSLPLAGKIIEELSLLWDKKMGIIEAEVASSHGLRPELVEEIGAYLRSKTGAKKIVLKEKINKKILGGLVIRYQDRVLDGSLKSKIDSLKEEMSK